MAQNPPAGFPQLTPYLYYRDAGAAVDWLTKTFGFEERNRVAGPDGSVGHAELSYGEGWVMLGSPGPDYRNPTDLGGVTVGLYLYVDDVDAHFRHAQGAGADIVAEPEDKFYGDRSYTARDPEGHEWHFATHVRDVPEDELAAAAQQQG